MNKIIKKLLLVLTFAIFLCACGKYKEISKEEKFSLLYRAEVLQDKDAREEMNKIYKKIKKYTDKKDENATKEMNEFAKIQKYLSEVEYSYKHDLPGGWMERGYEKYPPLKEITGEDNSPVSVEFRLYSEDKKYYDTLTDKLYTGMAISRYGNGLIYRVIEVKDGEVVRVIQKNKFGRDSNLLEEDFFDEKGEVIAYKKYTNKGGIKEELYVLERYDNGKLKKDYIVINGNEKGKIREYNTKGKVVNEIEK